MKYICCQMGFKDVIGEPLREDEKETYIIPINQFKEFSFGIGHIITFITHDGKTFQKYGDLNIYAFLEFLRSDQENLIYDFHYHA